MGVIYLRTCLVNGKQYVGQASSFFKRQLNWNNLGHRYANPILTEDREKYGLENWKAEILAESNDKEELDCMERYYIEKYNTIYPNGYNFTTGGKSGFKASDETRKKISDFAKTRTGSKNPFYGKKHIIHPMQGKHHSDEAKDKISKANKNGKTSTQIIQIKDSTEEVIEWESEREASRNNYDCGSISRATRGIYKKCGHHYKGSMWYKKEDYEKMLGENNS